MFKLAGDTLRQAMGEEGAVLGIEKALERASTNRAESADPNNRYHMLTLADLKNSRPISTSASTSIMSLHGPSRH